MTAAETKEARYAVSVVTDEGFVHSTERDGLPCPEAMEMLKHMAKIPLPHCGMERCGYSTS